MTNERQDDEIIGRALSRAIETIDVNQTPYERSRIAAAPARRSIFGWSQLGFAVVGIILAVALGSWLTRPTESQPGVAASPTTPPASPSAAGPSPTANPIVATSVPTWVYFPRDGLPPGRSRAVPSSRTTWTMPRGVRSLPSVRMERQDSS